MAKMMPEEKYRESFFERVQKECRKHGINCSMAYDRIHIYTKYEDFYFTPDPNEITLMHRNAQKDENGGYGYHVQGVWASRTPESLVREVVRHTKHRYTENGEYRSEKDIQAERALKQEKQQQTIAVPPVKKSKSVKRWKANRQAQIQEFRDELQKLCKERELNCRDLNQLTYIDNGFEEFLIEFTTEHTKIQSRRCMPLKIKEAYDQVYEPDELSPADVIKFVESHFVIQTQEEYARAFCEFLSNRCSQNGFKCARDGNRVYVYATNGTYYVDAICGKPIRIYQQGVKSVLVECPEDAHVIHVAHCIEDHDKVIAGKKKGIGWTILMVSSVSGWLVAAGLLVYILLS